MDSLKVRTPPDAHECLEKGRCETQPLRSGECHAPLQPAWSHGRRPFAKCISAIFGITVLSWLVISCGRRLPYHAWHWAGHSAKPPRPADADLHPCVASANWTTYHKPAWTPEYPFEAETTFSLPLDSDALYLVSRGAFQQGLVNIEQSTRVSDTVDVLVRVAYYDEEALKHATVCHTKRAERENGVAVLTQWRMPNRNEPEDQFLFEITLTLPAGNQGPLSVKDLGINMPDFNQNVANLQDSVLFDRIILATGNGKLSVESITFEVGHFASLNGEIDGHFNARSSLGLHTLNGRITPTVNLLHHERTGPSNLAMHTINGHIDAEVSLASETSTGGEFGVDARARNGNIGLRFTRTPVDSVLRCNAETTIGDIAVGLDSAFEGTYALQSTLGGRLVIPYCDAEDPTGRARHRPVSEKESAGRLEGDIRWVESGESSSTKDGHIVLKSVVSSVELFV